MAIPYSKENYDHGYAKYSPITHAIDYVVLTFPYTDTEEGQLTENLTNFPYNLWLIISSILALFTIMLKLTTNYSYSSLAWNLSIRLIGQGSNEDSKVMNNFTLITITGLSMQFYLLIIIFNNLISADLVKKNDSGIIGQLEDILDLEYIQPAWIVDAPITYQMIHNEILESASNASGYDYEYIPSNYEFDCERKKSEIYQKVCYKVQEKDFRNSLLEFDPTLSSKRFLEAGKGRMALISSQTILSGVK